MMGQHVAGALAQNNDFKLKTAAMQVSLRALTDYLRGCLTRKQQLDRALQAPTSTWVFRVLASEWL